MIQDEKVYHPNYHLTNLLVVGLHYYMSRVWYAYYVISQNKIRYQFLYRMHNVSHLIQLTYFLAKKY